MQTLETGTAVTLTTICITDQKLELTLELTRDVNLNEGFVHYL